jgi:hypothetical protein
MFQPQDSPGATAPTTSPTTAPDVGQQIAQLTEAVNRLVQQQTALPPRIDIGGEIPGGAAPRAAIDVAKLSPVQQIAIGLRDAKPVGPVRQTEDAPPQGAD